MDAFITRQPLIDPSQNVYAYQLRHRDGLNERGASDESSIMKLVANMAMLIDVRTGTSNARTFVPVTRDMLVLDDAEGARTALAGLAEATHQRRKAVRAKARKRGIGCWNSSGGAC